MFTYKGDLYRVPADGGTATPLTVHQAHDFMPVWSRDGKQIAFASDRYGNFDIFLIPAAGGEARRVTYHSAAEYPYSLSYQMSTLSIVPSMTIVEGPSTIPERVSFV